MSHPPQSPAMIIARKHQSAPKEHWADREIKKAAEEIDSGTYVPEATDADDQAMQRLGIALTSGDLDHVARMCSKGGQTFDEYANAVAQTSTMNELGRHPRVVEALDKMKREAEEAEDPQQATELRWMMWEMNQQMSASQKWAGQERWQGKENEEMRKGRILSVFEFYKTLTETIGKERVLMSTHAVANRIGLYVKNPLWEGDPWLREIYPQQQAQQLRAEGTLKMQEVKRLRIKGRNDAADKLAHEAGKMAEDAAKILMEMNARVEEAPKEFLRVATLQWPMMTEWMMMNFNEYGVPTTAKYLGWRTALLSMVRSRVITEAEAHAAFPVGSGPAASWYLEQMYNLRNMEVRAN